ncbi:MAG: hypothetical protein LBJ22_02870 [Synergistaceae bacterium]|nr:hypothetical protein [Synergistaceae bacterium]
MTAKLKLFIQETFCMPGCCCAATLRATDGEPLFSNPQDYEADVRRLLDALRARYGARLDISVVNSWGFFALLDVLRLKITPSKPTWVLNGKKIFEGLPDSDELIAAVDSRVGAESQ